MSGPPTSMVRIRLDAAFSGLPGHEQLLDALRRYGIQVVAASSESPSSEEASFVLLNAGGDALAQLRMLAQSEPDGALSRAVLIAAPRGSLRQDVELLRPAAALEELHYFSWLNHPDEDRGHVFYGRKDVAREMGAECVGGATGETEHYCPIRSA